MKTKSAPNDKREQAITAIFRRVVRTFPTGLRGRRGALSMLDMKLNVNGSIYIFLQKIFNDSHRSELG
jgi:hypothetical protein